MQFKALSARNIYKITPLIIILAYNLLHWRHTSKFLDSSLLYRFQFKLSIIRKWQLTQQPATVNFLSYNFWLIDSSSWGKSCLKCISQPKIASVAGWPLTVPLLVASWKCSLRTSAIFENFTFSCHLLKTYHEANRIRPWKVTTSER